MELHNKKIIFLILVLLASTTTRAQSLKIALQNSVLITGATDKGYSPTKESEVYFSNTEGNMFSYRTGITAQYARFKRFGIETGILFDGLSWKFAETENPNLGTYKGNTMNFNLILPLLGYLKLSMPKGGSYILGGGINFNYTISGIYRWRDSAGNFHNYDPITNYKNINNNINMGYQFLIGIEGSEYSQIRLSFSQFMRPVFNIKNDIYPYSLALSFIRVLN